MLPIVLFSHGKYAIATKETAEMIVGDLEKVHVLSLEPGGSVTGLEADLEAIIARNEGEVIVLCDILGGSPSNITFKLKQKYPSIISYTGFNLPVVLELIFNRNGTKNEINQIIKSTFTNSLNEIKCVDLEETNSSIMDL